MKETEPDESRSAVFSLSASYLPRSSRSILERDTKGLRTQTIGMSPFKGSTSGRFMTAKLPACISLKEGFNSIASRDGHPTPVQWTRDTKVSWPMGHVLVFFREPRQKD